MDTKNLSILVDVAHSGSFAETARRRDLDPSKVSRTVASMEKTLGFRVFQRSTRRLILTEAGKGYIARIRPLLTELEAASQEAREQGGMLSGQLSLTASVAFGERRILPLMPKFRSAYPNLTLRLHFTDANVDLLADNIDLAVRLTPAFHSELVGIKLFDTRYRVLASPQLVKQLAAPGTTEVSSRLGHMPIVALDLPHYRNAWRFVDDTGQIETHSIKPDILVSGALALRTCLQSGLGVGLIADWLAEDLVADGTLTDLFPGYRVTATDFDTAAWLLYPSRRFLPAKTRVAVDFLRQHLSRS